MPPPPWKNQRPLSGADYSAVELSSDGARLYVLDQRRLPGEELYRVYDDVGGAARAIRDMVVRGAPAIGIAAAYGMALAARAAAGGGEAYLQAMKLAGARLVATRPTAVNLAWAVDRCLALAEQHAALEQDARAAEVAELARAIHREDVAACRAMGEAGASHLLAGRAEKQLSVLTHCNAGALATGGYGSALGVVRALSQRSRMRVFACETRPYLQGARLTAWELSKDRIPVTVVSDSMVGHCMQRGLVDAVIVGADRIAANGDVANKIGTYGIACLARDHGVPFYVAAPWSTVDLATRTGASIVIEERSREELAILAGQQLLPQGVEVYNPAFDVTPSHLVSALFTERGVVEPSSLVEAAVEARARA